MINEIVNQVPALGVLAFIVVKFLQSHKQVAQHLDNMQDRCHKLQERALNSMDANTEVLGEVKQALSNINGSNR